MPGFMLGIHIVMAKPLRQESGSTTGFLNYALIAWNSR
jgi:hypothetical protein